MLNVGVSVLHVHVCVSMEHGREPVCMPTASPHLPILLEGGGKERLPQTLGLSLAPQCPWGPVSPAPVSVECPAPAPTQLSLTGTRVNKCCFSPILLRPVMENPQAGSEPRIDSPFHLTGWLSP